jgi:hypothetical protein
MDAAVIPLPSPLITPPVTKIYFKENYPPDALFCLKYTPDREIFLFPTPFIPFFF